MEGDPCVGKGPRGHRPQRGQGTWPWLEITPSGGKQDQSSGISKEVEALQQTHVCLFLIPH